MSETKANKIEIVQSRKDGWVCLLNMGRNQLSLLRKRLKHYLRSASHGLPDFYSNRNSILGRSVFVQLTPSKKKKSVLAGVTIGTSASFPATTA
jgi:hypothetical protein